MASIAGVAYRGFGRASRALLALLYGGNPSRLKDALVAAGIRLYYEAYLSVVFLSLVLSIVLTGIVVYLTGFIPLLAIPFIVLAIGYALPFIKAQDRASKLDMEAPFVAAYISVMATGGLSPYSSLRRLISCDLLPHTSRAAKLMEIDVRLNGMDPVTAIERSAEKLPSKEYKEFLLGYVYTLRTGGDVIHYLTAKTETMFRDLATRIKAYGERAAILMETYIAIIILSTLGLGIVYLMSIGFRGFWQGGFSAENFLMYSYLIVPIISVLFIYLADLSSFQEPIHEAAPYKVFMATAPALLFLVMGMFIVYVIPELSQVSPVFQALTGFISMLCAALNLESGFEPALGLGLALILPTLPAAIAHSYYTSRRGRGLARDVTNFLRDLTEARKTGASPESCIQQLSTRPYGRFSKYLKVVNKQLRWGQPLGVIYRTLRSRIKSWFALINLYFMVDAIEVGGGSPETLETMARFGEMLSSIEKEKSATLRPLMIMPYIGSAIMVFSTLLTIEFMRSTVVSMTRFPIPFNQIVMTIVPALVFQSYLMGLVAGKMSAGSVSAGFKHSIILTAISLLTVATIHPIVGLMQR